jgi:hypothetical protein
MARDEHYSPFGPMPEPQTSTPGELLYELEAAGSRYRCELRDSGEFGVEAQIFIDGELWQGCRFTVRALAVRWAEAIRDRLIRGEVIEWP